MNLSTAGVRIRAGRRHHSDTLCCRSD